MDPTNDVYDTHRVTRRSRRTILRTLAASGSVAALGGVTSAQDDPEEDTTADGEEVPVAGEFPTGETVGLQKVAENLPAPTDFDYVEVDGEVYHFVVTQTGQVFVTDFDDRPDADDPVADDPELDDSETDDDPEAVEDDDTDGDADEPIGDDPVEEEPPDEADPPADESDEFVFNGVTPAWIGLEPDEIDGEENPTLELTAGETYRFTWENGDGQPHNVVILDAGDDILERTEIVRETGETQTLEFEATEEMDRYVCEVHPGTMVGSVQVEPEEPPDDVDDPAPEPADALTPADMDEFLDIGDRLVTLGIGELGGYDERGLLGIAFHPDFAENRRFFVRYSAPERVGRGYDHTDVLAEFQADEDVTSADPDSERTIMEIQQPQDNHNGGRLAFGPDGYLYTSVGDGGNVHDVGVGHVDDWYDENEGGNAQDTRENLLGGIHRIDVDAEEDGAFGEYGVPADNPLVDSEDDLEEYWAWGFRNPWGMSIDDDGQVFVADAGQHRVESVYTVEEGGNYGWNVKEGSFCFSPDSPLEPPEDCPDEVGEDAGEARAGEPLRDPIAEYEHTRISEAFIDSSVVVGGHRYAGEAIPELEDAFVFGNWSSQGVAEADGEVLAAIDPGTDDDGADDADGDDGDDLVEVDERWALEELQFEGADDESLNRYVYSIERDEEGELYVLANTDFRPDPETGEVYRIVPAEEGEDVPEPEDAYVVDGDEADEEPPDDDPEEADPDDVDDEETDPDDVDDEEADPDDADDAGDPPAGDEADTGY